MLRKLTTIAFTAGLMTVCASCAAPASGPAPTPPTAPAQTDPVITAHSAARAWLAEVDAGNYQSSWQSASSRFKDAVTSEQWKDAAISARSPLGRLQSRSLKSAQYTTTLPDAADQEAVVLQFNAVYENHPDAIETVTPILDNGVWRVSGYYVK